MVRGAAERYRRRPRNAQHAAMPTRRASSLLELVILLAVLATVLALALPRAGAARDRAEVRAAASDVETVFAHARDAALARGAVAWVVFDSAGALVRVRVVGGGTQTRALGSIYGVALRTTRDSMSYDGRGLGRGAANLSVVLWRGRARATIVVSRLGRVRQ
jgi:type II secretory pathway pseudopilin PulG